MAEAAELDAVGENAAVAAAGGCDVGGAAREVVVDDTPYSAVGKWRDGWLVFLPAHGGAYGNRNLGALRMAERTRTDEP
jgi:hypothetical protein